MFVTILGVFTVILFLYFILLTVYFVRNDKVFDYRRKLLAEVSEAAHSDIAVGDDPYWRIDVFESVSYQEMVLKFWKSFDSFYEDHSFRYFTPVN